MKKIISIVSVVVMLLSLSITAFAGSVPEDLLSSDDAKVFFGEVVSYSENTEVQVKPVLNVKGDITLETPVVYNEPTPCGDFKVEEENVYLIAYYDENNPTYIFETTSYDVRSLKISGTEHDIWKRFEQYLNEGKFTEAENARINKLNENLTKTGDKISIKELMGLSAETTETVHLIVSGKKHQVDKDAFLALAEKIVVTDIENTNIDTEDGVYILINNDYLRPPLFISKGCKIEKHSPKFSRPPYADYTMNAEDLNKLYSLLPEEATASLLPPLENSSNTGVYVGISAAVVAVLGIVIACVSKKKKKSDTK